MIAKAEKKTKQKPALNEQGLLRCLYIHLKMMGGTLIIQRDLLLELQGPVIQSEYVEDRDAYRIFIKPKKRKRGIITRSKKLILPP